MGTFYFPPGRRRRAVPEDVAEHPYRIERMLTQLLHAGVLGRQKAILPDSSTATSSCRTTGLQAAERGGPAQPAQDPGADRAALRPCSDQVLLPVGLRLDLMVSGREGHPVLGLSQAGSQP